MTQVKFSLLAAGYCTHQEWAVVQGGGFKTLQFPALVGLIEHPTEGLVLFDTGYTHRFFEETRQFPARLYAMTTPVFYRPEDAVIHQLAKRGFRADQVRTVILSHFHADHVAGAKDFPSARFVYADSAYRRLKGLTGFDALKQAFLPGLLPEDFEGRSQPVEGLSTTAFRPDFMPFSEGRDLFNDGSVVLVDLPGHAPGHWGVVVQAEPSPVFLIGDACWVSRAYRENLPAHPIAEWLIFEDGAKSRETLGRLHRLHRENRDVLIVPSHCAEMWRVLVPGAEGG